MAIYCVRDVLPSGQYEFCAIDLAAGEPFSLDIFSVDMMAARIVKLIGIHHRRNVAVAGWPPAHPLGNSPESSELHDQKKDMYRLDAHHCASSRFAAMS
jgi:hypothetical protein